MRKLAIWASAHKPTAEQIESLSEMGYEVKTLEQFDNKLFKTLTNMVQETDRAFCVRQILSLPCEAVVQPAGDPAFQFMLGKERGKWDDHVKDMPNVMYAFSKRVSKNIPQEDGSVNKIFVFKFEGWV